jgi:hypothetical protein
VRFVVVWAFLCDCRPRSSTPSPGFASRLPPADYAPSNSRRSAMSTARASPRSHAAARDSAERRPCRQRALRDRSNPVAVFGPVLAPPCIRHRPAAIAGPLQGRPRAPQRGAAFAASSAGFDPLSARAARRFVGRATRFCCVSLCPLAAIKLNSRLRCFSCFGTGAASLPPVRTKLSAYCISLCPLAAIKLNSRLRCFSCFGTGAASLPPVRTKLSACCISLCPLAAIKLNSRLRCFSCFGTGAVSLLPEANTHGSRRLFMARTLTRG